MASKPAGNRFTLLDNDSDADSGDSDDNEEGADDDSKDSEEEEEEEQWLRPVARTLLSSNEVQNSTAAVTPVLASKGAPVVHLVQPSLQPSVGLQDKAKEKANSLKPKQEESKKKLPVNPVLRTAAQKRLMNGNKFGAMMFGGLEGDESDEDNEVLNELIQEAAKPSKVVLPSEFAQTTQSPSSGKFSPQKAIKQESMKLDKAEIAFLASHTPAFLMEKLVPNAKEKNNDSGKLGAVMVALAQTLQRNRIIDSIRLGTFTSAIELLVREVMKEATHWQHALNALKGIANLGEFCYPTERYYDQVKRSMQHADFVKHLNKLAERGEALAVVTLYDLSLLGLQRRSNDRLPMDVFDPFGHESSAYTSCGFLADNLEAMVASLQTISKIMGGDQGQDAHTREACMLRMKWLAASTRPSHSANSRLPLSVAASDLPRARSLALAFLECSESFEDDGVHLRPVLTYHPELVVAMLQELECNSLLRLHLVGSLLASTTDGVSTGRRSNTTHVDIAIMTTITNSLHRLGSLTTNRSNKSDCELIALVACLGSLSPEQLVQAGVPQLFIEFLERFAILWECTLGSDGCYFQMGPGICDLISTLIGVPGGLQSFLKAGILQRLQRLAQDGHADVVSQLMKYARSGCQSEWCAALAEKQNSAATLAIFENLLSKWPNGQIDMLRTSIRECKFYTSISGIVSLAVSLANVGPPKAKLEVVDVVLNLDLAPKLQSQVIDALASILSSKVDAETTCQLCTLMTKRLRSKDLPITTFYTNTILESLTHYLSHERSDIRRAAVICLVTLLANMEDAQKRIISQSEAHLAIFRIIQSDTFGEYHLIKNMAMAIAKAAVSGMLDDQVTEIKKWLSDDLTSASAHVSSLQSRISKKERDARNNVLAAATKPTSIDYTRLQTAREQLADATRKNTLVLQVLSTVLRMQHGAKWLWHHGFHTMLQEEFKLLATQIPDERVVSGTSAVARYQTKQIPEEQKAKIQVLLQILMAGSVAERRSQLEGLVDHSGERLCEILCCHISDELREEQQRQREQSLSYSQKLMKRRAALAARNARTQLMMEYGIDPEEDEDEDVVAEDHFLDDALAVFEIALGLRGTAEQKMAAAMQNNRALTGLLQSFAGQTYEKDPKKQRKKTCKRILDHIKSKQRSFNMGQIRCSKCQAEDTKCANCEGSGNAKCWKCQGLGKFTIGACKACNGTGELKKGGKGKGKSKGKKGKEPDQEQQEQEEGTTCRRCAGTGEYTAECKFCQGEGGWQCTKCKGRGTPWCADCQNVRRQATRTTRLDEQPEPGVKVLRCGEADVDLLRKMWSDRGGSGNVINAWKVDNPLLSWRVRKSRIDFRKEHGREADAIQGYHGTAAKNVLSIIQDGFNADFRCGQVFGAGEYFAKCPDISKGYCKGDNYMLVCQLCLGTQASSQELGDGDHIWVPHTKYYVIKNPAQVAPIYILKFGDKAGDEELERVLKMPEWSTLQKADVVVPPNRACAMAASSTDLLWIGYLHPDITDKQHLHDLEVFLKKNLPAEECSKWKLAVVRGKYTQAKARLATPVLQATVVMLNQVNYSENGTKRQITVDDGHGSPGQKCPRMIADFCRGRNLRFIDPCWCDHEPPPTKDAVYRLIPIELGSAKGDEIQSNFMRSAPFHDGHPTIVAISAIENPTLQRLHDKYRAYLTKKNEGEPKVVEFYHGTNNNILDILYTYGLQPPSDANASDECKVSGGKGLSTSLCDNRCQDCTTRHCWNKCHMFGLGIYLADLAQKSHRYVSQPAVAGMRRYRMVLCSVLVGRVLEIAGHLKNGPAMHDASSHRMLWTGELEAMFDKGAVKPQSLGKDVYPVQEHDLLFIKGLGAGHRPGHSVVNSEYISFHPYQCLPRYEIVYEI